MTLQYRRRGGPPTDDYDQCDRCDVLEHRQRGWSTSACGIFSAEPGIDQPMPPGWVRYLEMPEEPDGGEEGHVYHFCPECAEALGLDGDVDERRGADPDYRGYRMKLPADIDVEAEGFERAAPFHPTKGKQPLVGAHGGVRPQDAHRAADSVEPPEAGPGDEPDEV